MSPATFKEEARRLQRASGVTRRAMLVALGGAGGSVLLDSPLACAAPDSGFRTRIIPKSGEALPLVGLGSWITFNVGDDPIGRHACRQVIEAFFLAGGAMIDSSPMYGSSQEVIGWAVEAIGAEEQLFSATKVWTSDAEEGPEQIEWSRQLWRVPRFDLLQVHNLVAWEAHLQTLQAMKSEGRLRYVGVTTSHGRRHDELLEIMENQHLDFVQVTYNAVDREVEQRILPLAAEKRIAVIVNRPFRGGLLIDALDGSPLPDWAREIDCEHWAQILLKFIVSHPAVTCAIPATTQVAHLRENMGASAGRMPDPDLRARIAARVADV